MKKIDQRKFILLSNKRYRKKLKRKRKNNKYSGENSVYEKELLFRKKIDRIRLQKFRSNLFEFLKEENFIRSTKVASEIHVRGAFCFLENYDNTIDLIQKIAYSIIHHVKSEFTIDFTYCTKAEQSALIVLKIITNELIDDLKSFDRNLAAISIDLKLKIIESKNKNVNTNLVLFRFLNTANLDKEGFLPVHTIGYIKGSATQQGYVENKKGVIVTQTVRYINGCLNRYGVVLDAKEQNSIEGLLSEVLNNAEDHSPMNTYYVNANFSEVNRQHHTQNNNTIGQLNLSVMNFGYSIFEGFEETKEENAETYDEMNSIFNIVNSTKKHNFTKENLLTLYALQEGFSRLKYVDNSRGTGTMTFINSFFEISDYEDAEKDLKPYLNIISGSTHIFCDKRFKPFKKDNRYFITLNNSQNLLELPSDKHLINLTKKFPGTVLSAKIYLNREHLIDKIRKDGKDTH